MENLPKAINCRLKDEDLDIKEMLTTCEDKTARVKELLRKGIEAEKYGFHDSSIEEKRRRASKLAVPRVYTEANGIKYNKPLILVPN